MNNDNELVILDCTVRDGNYSVGFKFTEADTSLLTGQLSRLGFNWIEVGHGLGLGGTEAGKGDMPASDEAMIHAAKMTCGQARVGMFFIPGIGRHEHLDMAANAGLDFVRIGDEAQELERAFPYLEHARKLGLIPCVNMMKSYGVTPEVFAQKAKGAIEAGAEVVYCVDSAGSMLPTDLVHYYDATRAIVDCKMGFHGHNNLMMVIANCLAAYEHGARFLDVTLCGLGRSAGNAPTEILIAVFERLGISTGIDLFDTMDVIEQYMWPLVSQMRPHDMLGVTAGYSQFHSSLLPKVAEVANKYQVELRRLVAKVAFHDPVTIDDAYLETAAQELSNTDVHHPSQALLSFSVPQLSQERISNSMQSVQALIDGLAVSSAKRVGTRAVLHLVPSEEPVEGLLIPEFVMADDQTVMGRVTFGSLKLLRDVVALASPRIFMFLVNQEVPWVKEALQIVSDIAGVDRSVSVRDQELRLLYLLELLDRASQRFGRDALLIYSPTLLILRALEEGTNFKQVFLYGIDRLPQSLQGRGVILNDLDGPELLHFQMVICGASPTDLDAEHLAKHLAPEGRVLSIMPHPGRVLLEILGDRFVQLDLNLAYSGIVARYLASESMFSHSSVEPF